MDGRSVTRLTLRGMKVNTLVLDAYQTPMIAELAPMIDGKPDFTKLKEIHYAYTRECLALEVDTSFASRRVTRVLEAIVAERGQPLAIRCDNGPELTSRHFLAWCVERQIELVHIQPGKPTQNAHVESFHGRLREECLNVSWFQNLFDARRKIAAWQKEYNEERPHSSLGYRTPKEFATAMRAAEAGCALLAPPSSAAKPGAESVV